MKLKHALDFSIGKGHPSLKQTLNADYFLKAVASKNRLQIYALSIVM